MTAPWVWLYGASGVGKSAIGFEVFEQLARAGRRVAFVELDQIGMCMPHSRPGRAEAGADNLLGMLENFAAAGADGVVVSGDIAGPAMDRVLDRSPVRPMLVRLRANHDVVVERLHRRNSPQYAEGSRTYDEDFVVPAGDLDVTTHPASVEELAAAIVERVGPWAPRPTVAVAEPSPLEATAVLVTGPRAVGASTVAWHVLMTSVTAGVRTAYLDLQQLVFVRPSPASGVDLSLPNIAACWRGFRRQGAERLVLCGTFDDAPDLDRYRRLIPGLRIVALTARYPSILERAERRRVHKEIWLPGDDLFGREPADLPHLAVRSAAFTGEGADVILGTDGVDAAEVATRISWPAVAS